MIRRACGGIARAVARSFVRAAWLVAAISIGACAPSPPRVLVQLVTDYAPVRDFDTITVSHDGAVELREAARDRSFGRAVRVTEIELPSTERTTIWLTLRDGEAVVQAQPRRVVPIAGSTVVVTFLVTRDCAGVTCPDAGDAEAIACIGGRCARPECSPEHPELCPACPGGCATSAIACVDDECRPEGVCFATANDDRCTTGQICVADLGCVDPELPPSDAAVSDAGIDASAPPPNLAFMTSATFAADFGGAAFASATCRARAMAAGLPGNFVALLGTSSSDALPLLDGSRGWIDTAGNAIADQPTEWLDGTMHRPLRRDENGSALPYTFAWLGATPGFTCSDWSSTSSAMSGSIGYSTNAFFRGDVTTCADRAGFVCVQTGHDTAIEEVAQLGRVAFVAADPGDLWTPGGGIASADAACMAAAGRHGLAGSYLAAIATSTMPAFARFSATGLPWVSVSGIPLAATPEGVIASGTGFLDSFFRTAGGNVAPGSPATWAWTGDATTNCGDWMMTTGVGQTGDASSASIRDLLSRFAYDCAGARPLLCLEQ
jgi:hypothetical protein